MRSEVRPSSAVASGARRPWKNSASGPDSPAMRAPCWAGLGMSL